MTIQTTDAVYRELLTVIRAGVRGTVAESAVFLSEANNSSDTNKTWVQIIPSGGTADYERSALGLISERVEVVVRHRVAVDHLDRMTSAVADAELGVIAIASLVRTALIQSTLDDRLTIPMRMLAGMRIKMHSGAPTEVSITETYGFSYEIDWAGR